MWVRKKNQRSKEMTTFMEVLPTINIILEILLIITVLYLWFDGDRLEEEIAKLKKWKLKNT